MPSEVEAFQTTCSDSSVPVCQLQDTMCGSIVMAFRRATNGVTSGGIDPVTVLADTPSLTGQTAVATAVRKGERGFDGPRNFWSCLSQFLTGYFVISVAINAHEQREVP